MLEMHGASRLLFSFNDAIPGYVFSGLFFTDEYLRENPEKAKAFLRGLVRSFDYIKNNEKEARRWIPKYCGVEMKVAMRSALRHFEDGREPIKQLYKQQDIMIENGHLPGRIPIEDFIDYSYLPDKN
ncbi:MAG: ABC transporter substrate-binding protein [Proteobacteria bacterium]|nr:ABC transporter substrate-binding protein [Pseudomonadota bacterium]